MAVLETPECAGEDLIRYLSQKETLEAIGEGVTYLQSIGAFITRLILQCIWFMLTRPHKRAWGAFQS